MAILQCSVCPDYMAPAAAWQNKRYGMGLRVHNLTKDGSEARCVVCENKRGSSSKSSTQRKAKKK
jgi:hypothetical protein